MKEDKFHLLAQIIVVIGKAQGRLDAYSRVTSNTWGAISAGSDQYVVEIHNTLELYLRELHDLAVINTITFSSEELHTLKTKVYAYIKEKSLN